MGGPNLEVFKFGMYILFPIGWMYYFGTNLDNKFSVKDFWPTPEQTHKIPFEREEIISELDRLKRKRLLLRDRRLAAEEAGGDNGDREALSQLRATGAAEGASVVDEVRRVRQEGWRD